MLIIFKNNSDNTKWVDAGLYFTLSINTEPTPVAYAEVDVDFNLGVSAEVLRSVDCGIDFNFSADTDTMKYAGIISSDIDFSLLVDIVGIETFSTALAVVCFLFTLTGNEDGLDDIQIPISSFQARMRSGAPTYLSVTIPGVEYASEITDRPNGTMKIDMAYKNGDSWLQRETIIQAELENVKPYEGPKSESIVLSGYRTETFEGKEIILDKSTYRTISDGKVLHRIAKPNIYLRPGDTATVGLDTFTVDLISYTISASSQTMEISEQ